jgi:hypothetical protein
MFRVKSGCITGRIKGDGVREVLDKGYNYKFSFDRF